MCVIIVAVLSADYEIKVRMLENNPADLDRTEIERVVANQYHRLFRQQHDSKALSASGSTTTVDREREEETTQPIQGQLLQLRKDHRAEDCRSAKKKIEKSGDAPADKNGGGRGKATSVGVRSTLRVITVACAETWSTELISVRSEELRRGRCQQN